MNYIKALQLDNKALQAEVQSLRDSLKAIHDYAASSKFCYPNDTMNPRDITLRCNEAIAAADYQKSLPLMPNEQPSIDTPKTLTANQNRYGKLDENDMPLR
jgi:hypothetical protein